jgi:hypothetical protein
MPVIAMAPATFTPAATIDEVIARLDAAIDRAAARTAGWATLPACTGR